MDESSGMPEIKQVLGALIFGANRPLKISEMRKCLVDVAAKHGEETLVFGDVKDRDILAALKELDEDTQKAKAGFHLKEVAAGYRFQTDASCGKWLKNLLDKERSDRLSRPALETLAIIAYKQPINKGSIEAIRGVDVGHMIKTLMELQLVRIVGRSELPGRPFLYATTNVFLEHFGLKNLNELNDVEPMLAFRQEVNARQKKSVAGAAEEAVLEPSDDTAGAEAVDENEESDDVALNEIEVVDEPVLESDGDVEKEGK